MMRTAPIAASAKEEKSYRMDLRLTKRQRASYERAAELTGKTLTQWATTHLDENAQRDISDSTMTYLSPEAFDTFCNMLDAPLPDATKKLLTSKAVWE
ncbi:DUF1778 domain-containing protein [Enorma burkinafasonensis]|uniref:type II toxin-antitoxin system TacA family antitoxin n=1 Tax=Enorma burkinafasonensis TaxID=2590867 RepID=UPI001643E70A|nr:DUF1778 domain-containing protein [Enorma burkinafasonensis]